MDHDRDLVSKRVLHLRPASEENTVDGRDAGVFERLRTEGVEVRHIPLLVLRAPTDREPFARAAEALIQESRNVTFSIAGPDI